MFKNYILFSLLLCFTGAKAQLGTDAWHWQFGKYASLSFNTGTPVAGISSIITTEGSASVSDAVTGQLLFYTDGSTVWDKNNTIMPNGTGMFGGGGTSTQAALIIPKPGSTNIYYLISADQGGYISYTTNHGVNYSVVDMSLNGGLGDITVKNINLTQPPCTEKLTAIKHCNGKDYWIITHSFNSDAFNAYLLTSSGISTHPVAVVSHTGATESNFNGYSEETIGYIKASPNGKKLACAVSYMQLLELYDFNNSTGYVGNNPISFPSTSSFEVYGLSFSPDNTKLYVGNNGNGDLYQYDLSSGIASTIISSRYLVTNYANMGALQIGPDGKIYVATDPSLSVINNPNNAGVICNYSPAVIHFNPGSSSLLGLPNFIDAYNTSPAKIPDIVECNTFKPDTLNAGIGYIAYQWSTGATTQTISINAPGTYWVILTNAYGCEITDTIKAYTINPAQIDILKDTTVCSLSGSYTANATCNGAQSYLWFDGSTNPIKNISASGNYWVNIQFQNGCIVKDTFHLTLNTKPHVNLGNDTLVCQSITQPIILHAGIGNSYQWSTGANTQTISVTAPGYYWINVSQSAGCNSVDTIHIQTINANTHYRFDTALCSLNRFPFLLQPPTIIGHSNQYSWSDGTNGPVNYASGPNMEILTLNVNGGSCIITDTFNILLDTLAPHMKNVSECNSFTAYTLNAGAGYSSYAWSTSANTQTISINSTGVYWVKVTSIYGCVNADTVHATIVQSNNINVLKDTTVCSSTGTYTVNATYNGATNYFWYDGSTNPIKTFSNSGTYFVYIFLPGNCLITDTFHLTLNHVPTFSLGGDQSYCDSLYHPIQLYIGTGFSSFNWSTGATHDTISVDSAGTYWVNAITPDGCIASDSITIKIYPLGNTTMPAQNIYLCQIDDFPITVFSSVPNTNGLSNNAYYWNNGSTSNYSQNYENVYNAGTYSVNVFINGVQSCTVKEFFNVSYGITPPYISDIIECNPLNINSLDAGWGYSSYNWSTSANTQAIAVNNPGKYWVTVINSGGCKATDTVNIILNQVPNINILHDTIICTNSPLVLSINAYYTNAFSYQWSDGFTSPLHTITSPGNYWVDYSFEGKDCISRDSFKYIINIPPIINVLRDTTICSNIPIFLNEDATYPNVLNYNWNNGNSSPLQTISTPGIYWVDYSLNNSCNVRDSFIFVLDTVPYINLGQDVILCKPSYTLTATQESNYIWSTGSTNQQIIITNSGTYSVVVTNIDGCKNSDTINVALNSPPIIDTIKDSIECGSLFSPINFTVNYPNAISYNWSDGVSGQSHMFSTPGNYWVQYILNNTCISTDSFNLFLNPYPRVNLGNDTSFCSGSLNLNAYNPSSTYIWNTGATTPIITATNQNVYWVKVNQNTCVISDTIRISPDYSVFNFEMPNIVTPNNDGINDVIDFSKYHFSSLQIEIFDRWGNQIFESSDPNSAWHPICNEGTYFYITKYLINCGNVEMKETKGYITVIR